MSNQFTWDESKKIAFAEFALKHTPLTIDYLIQQFEASHTPAPEPKDWQIVQCYNDDVNITHSYLDGSIGGESCEKTGCKIHSVKRLSDNTVWTVGEAITTDSFYLNRTIKRFFEKEGVMYAQFNEGKGSNDGCRGLNGLQKLPPRPLPLFTTKDGKEISPGTPYWHIVSDWTPQMEIAVEAGREEYKSRKMQTFSTESAANEYILMNKPQFSLQQIVDEIKKECDGTYKDYAYWNFVSPNAPAIIIGKLKEISQSKQSNNK